MGINDKAQRHDTDYFYSAPGVYSPGTDDLGYGYANAQRLTSAQAVLNADTYALYANAIYLGC